MKALKITAIVLGGILVLLVIAVVLALMPSVQTWAVRKALAGQPGTTAEVGHVAAGFSSADIRDVRIIRNGIVLSAKSATANYSAWDYLKRGRLVADRLDLQDVVVDLRATTDPTGATRAPATSDRAGADQAKDTPATAADERRAADKPTDQTAFNGLLNQARLPFDVQLGNLTANGRVLLPAERVVDFRINGKGIETGKRGTVDFNVDLKDPAKDAAASAAHVTGVAAVHIAADRRIDVAELDVTVAADGPKLPDDQLKLQARAEQPAAGGNEGYTLTLGLVRGGAMTPILKMGAQYVVNARELSGAWELTVRSEQFAALLTGLGLPQLVANGGGKFSFKPDTSALAAAGNLEGTASGLEKLRPELASIGAMNFSVAFDGGFAGERAQLERLQLNLVGADGRKLAEIVTAQSVGFSAADKRVTLADPKGDVARLNVHALPLAWAQPFVKDLAIESGDVSLALAVEAEPDGSRIRVRSVEPVALRGVTLRSGEKRLVEQLTLTAAPRIDYSASRVVAELADIKLTMPAGDTLSGVASADVTDLATTPSIAFSSQLQARLVSAHLPYVKANVGPVTVETGAQGRLAGEVLELAKSATVIRRENGGLLASMEIQQRVTANLKAGTFAAENPGAPLARLKLGELPLAWAQVFVANSQFAGAVAGGTVDITARTANDLTITTVEPLVVRGASVSIEGKPLAQALDLMANLTATKQGDILRYEVRRIEVKQGPAVLAGLSVSGEVTLGAKPAMAAKGTFEADLAALMNQPAAASFATLSRGRVTSNFEANYGEAIQAKLALTARGLVAKENNRPLGDLEVGLNATVKPDGTGTINAPVTLSNGARRSDLALSGSFGRTADQKTFLLNGQVTSNQLFVDDFKPLAGIAPAAEKPDPKPKPAAKRDTEPFWKGVNGKLALDLKRVVYGKDYTIGNVRGGATITNSRLALDGLEGMLNQNPFKTNAVVTFNAAQPKPYSLTGGIDVQNFDVGALLRSANPQDKPALESRISVLSQLGGNGATVGELAKNVFGKFELSGSNGTLNLLARKGAAGTAVNVLSAGLAILGAEKQSKTTMAAAELARLLNSVSFDSLKIQVERGADLSLKVTSLELVSPILRLTGSGRVENREGVAPENQPMQLLLQMGAKGELLQVLSKTTSLLGGAADDKGYQLLSRQFTIGGTPSKPDNSSFWKMLLPEVIELLR